MSLPFILIQGQPYDGNRCGISPRPFFTLKMEILEHILPQVTEYMSSGLLSKIVSELGRYLNSYKPSSGATWLKRKSLGDAAGYLKTFTLHHGSLDSNSISKDVALCAESNFGYLSCKAQSRDAFFECFRSRRPRRTLSKRGLSSGTLVDDLFCDQASKYRKVPVFRRLYNAIRRINHYPLDKCRNSDL